MCWDNCLGSGSNCRCVCDNSATECKNAVVVIAHIDVLDVIDIMLISYSEINTRK